MATGYYCSDHVGADGKGGNPNSRCASTLLCSGNWGSLVKGDEGALYAIGGPTLEMWVASWNQKHGKDVDADDGITLSANGTDSSKPGYYVGDGNSPTTTYKEVNTCKSGYSDKLYFPHQSKTTDLDNDESDETCYGYWLASPSAYSAARVRNVRCEGNVYSNGYGNYHFGLRPVVCLDSGVKLANEDEN